MKSLILIVAAALVLSVLTWFLASKPSYRTGASAQPQDKNAVSAKLKDLLFADQPLEEVIKNMEKRPAQGVANDPFSLWVSSLAASQKGQPEAAKNYLKQALTIPDIDSRVRLSTWKALRELGERPSPNVAAEVQGVICELHNEAGVGTIAAYSDGRARWIGGQGAVTVWEAPGTNAEINDRIRELLKSAEPLIRTAPATDKHKTPEPELDHFRVSILTYGGIHTIDVYGPDLSEGHQMAPTFVASVKLLEALQQKAEAEKPQGKVKPD